MYNYEHETDCPDHKGIRKFLWNDYFHDSDLQNIRFDREWRKVILMLESCRDIDYAWERLKGDGDIRHQYIEEHKDEYIYTLLFSGTVYFHVERMMNCGDYINGRFKDSALLRRLQPVSKKTLYHFRIQFADGYADILFSGFQIRKKAGRVNYSSKEISCQTMGTIALDDQVQTLDKAAHAEDYSRFRAMRDLYQANHPELLHIARKNVELDPAEYMDSVLYAAYLLGKQGGIMDIPCLLKLYYRLEAEMAEQSICPCSAVLPKRNILDAIDWIAYKDSLECVMG